MKILKTKLSNPMAYLLLVFAIISSALILYGQFSNLEFEAINNTTDDIIIGVSPEDNTFELDDTLNDSTIKSSDESPILESEVSDTILSPENTIPSSDMIPSTNSIE